MIKYWRGNIIIWYLKTQRTFREKFLSFKLFPLWFMSWAMLIKVGPLRWSWLSTKLFCCTNGKTFLVQMLGNWFRGFVNNIFCGIVNEKIVKLVWTELCLPLKFKMEINGHEHREMQQIKVVKVVYCIVLWNRKHQGQIPLYFIFAHLIEVKSSIKLHNSDAIRILCVEKIHMLVIKNLPIERWVSHNLIIYSVSFSVIDIDE